MSAITDILNLDVTDQVFTLREIPTFTKMSRMATNTSNLHIVLDAYDDLVNLADNGTVSFNTGTWNSSTQHFESISTAMTILNNENVGIGTASPSEKLEVDGNINSTARVTGLDGNEVMIPLGGIIMWTGTIDGSNRPVINGTPDDNWRLCDGTDYGGAHGETPDLRNNFIVGSGDLYAIGDIGGYNSITLDETQIPSHTHNYSGTTSIQTSSHTHNIDVNTDSDTHDHGIRCRYEYTPGGSLTGGVRGTGDEYDFDTYNDTHSHNVNGVSESQNQDHDHTFSGTTTSAGSTQSHENRPPYYALAFIMRIA